MLLSKCVVRDNKKFTFIKQQEASEIKTPINKLLQDIKIRKNTK